MDSLTESAQYHHPRDGDERGIAALNDVVASFHNSTHWYNNASFVLPLAGACVVGVAALLKGSSDLYGFAAFLTLVTGAMVPVVLAGWRQTATTVVLTREEIVSLHAGRVLKRLQWRDVRSISERETQGNVRWQVTTETGERLLLDGELEDLPRLVRLARELARLTDEDGA